MLCNMLWAISFFNYALLIRLMTPVVTVMIINMDVHSDPKKKKEKRGKEKRKKGRRPRGAVLVPTPSLAEPMGHPADTSKY